MLPVRALSVWANTGRNSEEGGAVMAIYQETMHFLITNCPGPFLLVSGWVHMLEKHGNRFEIELTVRPFEAGIKLLGHEREFKLPFQVMLMGATTKYGHGRDEPRNVRMFGRFLIPSEIQMSYPGRPPFVDPMEAAAVLNEWQWEVVFNPSHRGADSVGFVAKLDSPLPEEWTL
jgi:hypothetical protein